MQTTQVLQPQPSLTPTVETAGVQETNAVPEQAAADFQNFLKLLTAQLRNQDPLSPLDSTEFVAQLASFSSVEQLVKVNQRLDAIASSIVSDGIDKYASWIGRDVEVEDGVAFIDNTPMRFRLSGNPAAARVELMIADAAGVEVARFAVQNDNAVQRWNRTGGSAPVAEGNYSVTAIYYQGDEIINTETANTFGTVSEIRLADDGAVLGLRGGAEVNPSKIVSLGEHG